MRAWLASRLLEIVEWLMADVQGRLDEAKPWVRCAPAADPLCTHGRPLCWLCVHAGSVQVAPPLNKAKQRAAQAWDREILDGPPPTYQGIELELHKGLDRPPEPQDGRH